ncbi:MAG: flavin reductase family protein [Gemmatimonadales bacterium]
MLTDSAYEVLRTLASPVVAVTSANGRCRNGMILDSAIRASISPVVPRLAVYIHKWHLTHELVASTRRFVLHLLHRDQFDLIRRLGFASGRDRDKLAGLRLEDSTIGVPVLGECYAAFECRVVNTMDAGASTFFLADVVETRRGPGTDIMTAEYFRANMPGEWRGEFERNYREAQDRIAATAEITNPRWP